MPFESSVEEQTGYLIGTRCLIELLLRLQNRDYSKNEASGQQLARPD